MFILYKHSSTIVAGICLFTVFDLLQPLYVVHLVWVEEQMIDESLEL